MIFMKLCLDVVKVESKDVKLNWDIDLNKFIKKLEKLKGLKLFDVKNNHGVIATYESEDFEYPNPIEYIYSKFGFSDKPIGISINSSYYAKLIADYFTPIFLRMLPNHLSEYSNVIIEEEYYKNKIYDTIYSMFRSTMFYDVKSHENELWVRIIDDMYKGYELKFYIKDK